MKKTLRLLLFVLLLLSVCLQTSAVVAGDDAKDEKSDYEKVYEEFQKYILFEPLGARAKAIENLAATKNPKAVEDLQDRYFAPDEPALQERYLVTGSLEHFIGVESAREPLEVWQDTQRKVNRRRPDFYFEHFAYCNAVSLGDTVEIEEILGHDRPREMYIAAALQAMGKYGKPELAAFVSTALTEERINAYDHRTSHQVLVSAAAAFLSFKQRGFAEHEIVKDKIDALIKTLDYEDELSETTRYGVARHLAAFYDVKTPWMRSSRWFALKASREPGSGRTRSSVNFMGIGGNGERIVYLLDMSDSMLMPLTAAEIEELKGSITGGKSHKKDNRKKGEIRAEDLPWERIKTRFDAAREFLRLSLMQLDKDMTFAVVTFGDEAKVFTSTQRMMKASRFAKQATLEELYKIQPGAKSSTRPHGTLSGLTNLHAGIVKAFQLNERGIHEEGCEHTDKDCLRSGFDTLFILSDGRPVKDSYALMGPEEVVPAQPAQPARPASTRRVRDPETGQTRTVKVPARPAQPARPESTTRRNYRGPFIQMDFFERDLKRLNMYRKAEISCIGFGEADFRWLELCSRIGLGKLQLFGKVGEAYRKHLEAEKRRKEREEERKRQEEEAKNGHPNGAIDGRNVDGKKDERDEPRDDEKKGGGGFPGENEVPKGSDKPKESGAE